MSLFVPINGTMQAALVDPAYFGTREYELWIDSEFFGPGGVGHPYFVEGYYVDGYFVDDYFPSGASDLYEITSYLKNNDLSIEASAGIVATTAKAVLRNSQQTFEEGDLAGAPCEIRAGIAGQTAVTIFTGWVSKEGCQRSIGSLTDDTVTISMHDRVKRQATARKMTPAYYVGFKILDTTSVESSLFHQLADEMGLGASDLDVVTINHTKDAIGYDGNTTAWKEIQSLAAAYLADRSCYFRYDGKLRLVSRYQSGWSQTSEWTIDTDSVGNLCRVKYAGLRPISCTRARTAFDDYEALDSQVIYRNTEGWITSTKKCDIDVGTGEFWPGPNPADKARLEYALPDTGEGIPLGTSVVTPTTGADGDGDDIESDGGVLTLAGFNGIINHADVSGASNDDTVTINSVTFTKAAGTTVASREFADAAGLVSCVNDATYGVSGVTAAATDDVVVCTASSGTVTLSKSGGIRVSKTRQKANAAEIVLYNGNGGTATIRKLEITGVPSRIFAEREVEDLDADVADEDHVDKTIDGRYMVSDEQAHATTQWWVDWGGSARKEYQIETYWLPHVQKGAVVTIELPGGSEVECYVESYKHRAPNGPMTLALTELELVAIESFSATGDADVTVVSPGNLSQVASVLSIKSDIEDRPTYSDVDDGYVNPAGSKGTTTPTQVVVGTCKGMYRSIVLQWDRQYYLTNFDHYELQVSDDDATWYSLKFDGTDWKDTLAQVTSVPSEMLVHANIPLEGDADDPSGPTLYYRVRRVTKASVNGDWSASASATVATVAAGDIAQDAIYANNIIASEITALLLKVAEIYIGFAGTGAYSAPADGDRRIYANGDSIRWQEALESAWAAFNQIRIGGTDSNGHFLPFLQCRGVIHPSFGNAFNQGFVPASGFLVYSFENSEADQYGRAPQMAFDHPVYDTGYIGTYSITSDEPSVDGGVDNMRTFYGDYDRPLWTPGLSQVVCGYFRAAASGGVTSIAKFEHDKAGDNQRIELQLAADGNLQAVVVRVNGGGTTIDTISSYLPAADGYWHFVALYYDGDENEVTLILDDEYEVTPCTAGAWTDPTTGDYTYNQFSVISSEHLTLAQTWLDEFAVGPDSTIDVEVLLQFGSRGIAWRGLASVNDVILAPRDGNRVMPLYDVPDPFMGFPHMLDADDRTDGYDITDTGVSDTWEEADLSALLPAAYLHSIRWVRCRVQITSSDAADTAIICARHKGSTATVAQSYLKRIGAEIGALTWIADSEVVDIPVRDGVFEYRRYSSSHPISTFNAQLWGYYV